MPRTSLAILAVDMIGILTLLGISGAVAAILHWLCHRFVVACLLSAVASTVLFQIVAYVSLGYLDPFFLIAAAVGAVISFIIALAVGAVIRQLRSV